MFKYCVDLNSNISIVDINEEASLYKKFFDTFVDSKQFLIEIKLKNITYFESAIDKTKQELISIAEESVYKKFFDTFVDAKQFLIDIKLKNITDLESAIDKTKQELISIEKLQDII
jgi:uncharacterized protein Yka (UPF0111/DUF47 family)